jgi:hypothetical protein
MLRHPIPQVWGMRPPVRHPFPVGVAHVADESNPFSGFRPGGNQQSPDGGAHWSFSLTGIESVGIGVSAVAIDPQAPATIYAATLGAGVFRSTDGGRSWAPFNAGLRSLFLNDLQVSPSGACLHATAGWTPLSMASQQGGVFDFVIHSDPCAPPINPLVSVNERTFSAGQTLVSSAALMNLGDPASLRPLATGVSLAAPFTATAPNFVSCQWTGDEPRGEYRLFLLVTRPAPCPTASSPTKRSSPSTRSSSRFRNDVRLAFGQTDTPWPF